MNRPLWTRLPSFNAPGFMPSGKGQVLSAVAFADAVRLHFQNVIDYPLNEKPRREAGACLRLLRLIRARGGPNIGGGASIIWGSEPNDIEGSVSGAVSEGMSEIPASAPPKPTGAGAAAANAGRAAVGTENGAGVLALEPIFRSAHARRSAAVMSFKNGLALMTRSPRIEPTGMEGSALRTPIAPLSAATRVRLAAKLEASKARRRERERLRSKARTKARSKSVYEVGQLRVYLNLNEYYAIADRALATYRHMPDYALDDIRSDMVEALINQTLQAEDACDCAFEFVANYNREFSTHKTISTEEKLFDDGTATRGDYLTTDDYSYAE